MSNAIRTIATLAAKEVRDGLRNRWIVTTIFLLGVLALALSYLGAAPTGEVKVGILELSVVSLTSLSMYLLPLIALILAFDALVGEFEHGTMLLLLTYPVARWQIIVGKFVGHTIILLLAILIGYGGALLILVFFASDGDSSGWQAYMYMMSSSLLLGCAFLSIGYLISILASERAVAIGSAIGAWLLLVVLYDLALLAVVLSDAEGMMSETLFSTLMLINPADAYRILNFSNFESVGQLVGLNNISSGIESTLIWPLASLTLWVFIPFLATTYLFHKREL
jgi:Cu-processing system permease protein